MASIPAVLRHVRRARREATRQSTAGQFREYETAYEEILLAVRAAGGEELLEANDAEVPPELRQR